MTNTHSWGAVSGNPIEWNIEYTKDAFISRNKNKDDMQFGMLHEIGHIFDCDIWKFDSELMANFKMAYVLENLNITVSLEEFSEMGRKLRIMINNIMITAILWEIIQLRMVFMTALPISFLILRINLVVGLLLNRHLDPFKQYRLEVFCNPKNLKCSLIS